MKFWTNLFLVGFTISACSPQPERLTATSSSQDPVPAVAKTTEIINPVEGCVERPWRRDSSEYIRIVNWFNYTQGLGCDSIYNVEVQVSDRIIDERKRDIIILRNDYKNCSGEIGKLEEDFLNQVNLLKDWIGHAEIDCERRGVVRRGVNDTTVEKYLGNADDFQRRMCEKYALNCSW